MSIRSGVEQALIRIESTRDKAGRPDPVKLELAVKTRAPGECYEAVHVLAGLGRPILFGHNHIQEIRNTVAAVRQVEGAELRLIGPLQSNKINHTLGCVDTIGLVDCPILIEKISVRANREVPVFLEVNVSREETKHGCHPSEVDTFVDVALGAEHLRLCGFTTVGLNSPIEKDVHAAYAQLHSICERIEAATELCGLELSMGMPANLEWVVAEGTSIVRIGTAASGECRPCD